MNTPRFTPEELDRLRELAFEWGKIVSKRAFGDDGPGLDVDFTTREQIESPTYSPSWTVGRRVWVNPGG